MGMVSKTAGRRLRGLARVLAVLVVSAFATFALPHARNAYALSQDNFDSPMLSPQWTFINPVGNGSYSLAANDGHIRLSVPAGSSHDCWNTTANCVRLVQADQNTDATYQVKIDGNSLTSAFQTYGIWLSQDNRNYLRFEFWRDAGGVHVKAWKVINGSGSQAVGGPQVTLTGADSLRVTRAGNTYTLAYQLGSQGAWQTAGSFTQSGLAVAQSGIHVVNASNNAATTARVDSYLYSPAGSGGSGGSGGTGGSEAGTWQRLSSAAGDLPAPNTGNEQTASLVLDIDKDGRNDFVIAERTASPSVVWYRRTATGWDKYPIDNTTLPIEAGGAFNDIDRDGDLDIVFGGDWRSNAVWWWENPYPNFSQSAPWNRYTLKNSGSNMHHDEAFGDFDGDGANELAFWNQDARQLFVAEIPASPKTVAEWPRTAIYTGSGPDKPEGLATADIDLNGVTDIVGGGMWFGYNAAASTYTASVVDPSKQFSRAAAGQIIPGGRPELAFGCGDCAGPLDWYQWDDATATWTKHFITNVDHGHTLDIVDANQDGTMDIFAGEMRLNGDNADAKIWVFEGDGAGSLTPVEVASGYDIHEGRIADLDGDGDYDILGKPYNWGTPGLNIWLRDGAAPLNNWARTHAGSLPGQAVFVRTADLDGDGKKDIAAGGWWWKNPGTVSGAWTRHTIGAPLNNIALLADFDNDGDTDIFGTQGVGSAGNHQLAWAQNDGAGHFTVRTNIASAGSGDFLQGAAYGNFTGANQIVLSWHNGGGGLHAVTVPANPAAGTWSITTLSAVTQGEELTPGDIDRDGDLDLLLGTRWLRNDSTGWTDFTLGDVSDLGGGTPDRNKLADINKDGRLDAVVGLEDDTEILWFEAPADPTQPWTRHILATVAGQGFSLDAADFDNDGDTDVVMGEHRNTPSNRVLIAENNGDGSSWTEHTIDSGAASAIDHHDGTQAVDLDNDGDLDIVSIGWNHPELWIYENRNTVAGPGPAPNQAPVVSAGADQQLSLQGGSVSATLSGSAADDGQPAGAGLGYAWTQVSGPAAAAIAGASSASTQVTFTQSGTYSFRLSVSDTDLTGSDTVTVTVQASASVLDEFNGPALGPGWSFVNPVGNANYSLTGNPGHLAMAVPAGSSHDCWGSTAHCARLVRADNNANASYEVKIDGGALTSAYQTYGIWLAQDAGNYLRFEFWRDGSKTYVKGWKVINNNGSQTIGGPQVTLTGADRLRVVRSGNTYTLSYRLGNGTWQNAGSTAVSGFAVRESGVMVVNAGSNAATAGNFDYFLYMPGQ